MVAYSGIKRGRLIDATRSTAWRWVQAALGRAQELGVTAPGKHVGTHTLRHSTARHWLASGIPIIRYLIESHSCVNPLLSGHAASME